MSLLQVFWIDPRGQQIVVRPAQDDNNYRPQQGWHPEKIPPSM